MLRLTGGEFRGRVIEAPAGNQTRPTQARLRQALFNSIQTTLPGARVLDLFAGSGALGFEALSRGASRVVFVEKSKSAAALIRKNAALLRVEDQIEVIQGSWESQMPRRVGAGSFDLILADPPYSEGWETRLIEEFPWNQLLSAGGVFCLEWGVLKSQVQVMPDSFASLKKVREKLYGESCLTTYERDCVS
jgi:16S rRNA (guanine966-N2)-methyltransferase